MGDKTYKVLAGKKLPSFPQPASMKCSWRSLLINGNSRTVSVKVSPLGFSYYSASNFSGWRGYNKIHSMRFDYARNPFAWKSMKRTDRYVTENLATRPAKFATTDVKNKWCTSSLAAEIKKLINDRGCKFSKPSDKAQLLLLVSFLTFIEEEICPKNP